MGDKNSLLLVEAVQRLVKICRMLPVNLECTLSSIDCF